MAVSRALRRLWQVLQLEEEQTHGALERALGELGRLEQLRLRAVERERRGRRLVAASAGSGEITDRLAGLEETRAARQLVALLKVRVAEAEKEAAVRRESFLAKRIERRQSETLLEEAEARDAAEANRRGQQSLDEWFLQRGRGATAAEKAGIACRESPRETGGETGPRKT